MDRERKEYTGLEKFFRNGAFAAGDAISRSFFSCLCYTVCQEEFSMVKKRRKTLAVLVLAAVLAALYCNYSLDLEDWTVCSPLIPEAFDGLRVTLLTDLHGAEYGQDSRRLLDAVARSEPDLIAISGDLADEYTDLDMLDPLLKGLAGLAPVYYVTGNHEWVRDDTEALLDRIAACGVTVLRNDYVVLTREDQSIVLAGTEDPNGYADMETPAHFMSRIRAEQGEDAYVLMLYHRNDSLDLWSGLGADLVLAGHGHGGVVRLPFVGGLLGVDRKLFPDNCEGLYTRGRTTLAVSRGLGGIRLWNRPHLPTVVLTREGQP